MLVVVPVVLHDSAAGSRRVDTKVMHVTRWMMLIKVTGAASGGRRLARLGLLAIAAVVGGCGLTPWGGSSPGPHDTRRSYHDPVGMQISYPEVDQVLNDPSLAARESVQPLVAEDPSELEALEMTLAEAVQMALHQSPVIRELGGSLLTLPNFSFTVFDPALAHANPMLGVEAALAAFDLQYTGALSWNRVEQPSNIQRGEIVEQFTPLVFLAKQANYRTELSKRTAQGGSFAVRHVTLYDRNNRPLRQFRSDFIGWVEAEWRQPLMRGAGTQFNRIAGPGSQIGQYNGVLIARANEEVALADFEAAVVRLVNDVEEAYWNLSAAYRILEATLRGREAALQTFQYQEVRLQVGAGRSDEEAQAQSQYYQFQAQVENALSGLEGLYAVEQRLRYLLGMPPADGRLIKPTTDPSDVKVVFDWDSALSQAMQRRVELRRQRFNLKRREMELYAARLNRRPQLDFLGVYRYRGLGDNLFGSPGEPLDNLFTEIFQGNYQEWQAGMELTFPVGLRAASNAVAHARLALQRENALLNETELRISHDLASAVRRLGLAHSLLETNYNAFLADMRQVDVLRRRYRDGTDNINFLLQAQRQVITSEINFYRSLADYNLAIRDLHREKGSLLAYNGVALNEGPWDGPAYRDAYQTGRFLQPRRRPEAVDRPRPLTGGPFDSSAPQQTLGSDGPVVDLAPDTGEIEPGPLPEPLQLEFEPPVPDTAASDSPAGEAASPADD